MNRVCVPMTPTQLIAKRPMLKRRGYCSPTSSCMHDVKVIDNSQCLQYSLPSSFDCASHQRGTRLALSELMSISRLSECFKGTSGVPSKGNFLFLPSIRRTVLNNDYHHADLIVSLLAHRRNIILQIKVCMFTSLERQSDNQFSSCLQKSKTLVSIICVSYIRPDAVPVLRTRTCIAVDISLCLSVQSEPKYTTSLTAIGSSVPPVSSQAFESSFATTLVPRCNIDTVHSSAVMSLPVKTMR